MLPKKNRADKKTVDRIFKEGKFVHSPNLTFKYLFSSNKNPQISFIAPKSVAKLAVQRNLLRRCGYDALGKYLYQFPAGTTGAFIFKKKKLILLFSKMKLRQSFIKLIKLYQKALSPDTGFLKKMGLVKKQVCVFYPTCSEYTKQAIEKYGILKGVWLGTRRIIRCHPWQKNHIDPLK